MKTLCQFDDGKCSQCGFPLPVGLARPCRPGRVARASNRAIEIYGLGNLVESTLEKYGVTKDRWVEFKKRLGLPATCNCDRRKEYLNKLGAEFGEKAKNAVSSLLGFGLPKATDNVIEEKSYDPN